MYWSSGVVEYLEPSENGRYEGTADDGPLDALAPEDAPITA